MDRIVVHTERVHDSEKPNLQGIRLGELDFASGQVAHDPETNIALDGGLEAQPRRVLDNLREVLETGQLSRARPEDDVLPRRYRRCPRFNETYREYFPVDPPARSTYAVAALSSGFLVEIEAIAAVGSGAELPD